MNKTIWDILYWLQDRLSEASTYVGIAALMTALHFSVDNQVIQAITNFGIAGSGLIAVILKDTKPNA